MRIASAVLLSAVIGIVAAAPAVAGTLDSNKSEWTFDMNYTNQSSVGSTTNVRFAYGYLPGKGYSEIGLDGTYMRIEDNTFGGTTDSTVLGLFYAWNWTPTSSRATGFLSIGAGGLGGDLHTVFDYSVDGALGVKLFVGNSAAITARFTYQRLYASTSSGFSSNDEDFTGVAIGLALYTNRK